MSDAVELRQATFVIKSANISHYLDEQGEPWFLARDVCEYLELADTASSVRKVWDENKVKQTAFLPSNPGRHSMPTGVGTPSGQDQEMWFVNEPGLYQLIFTSRKPEAVAFQRWVFNDLLPALRKNGRYVMGQTIATLPAVLEPVPTLLPPQKTQTPKGVSGTRGVTCDGCGKVFKHESALAGHSWVHLPGKKGGRRVGSKQPRVDD